VEDQRRLKSTVGQKNPTIQAAADDLGISAWRILRFYGKNPLVGIAASSLNSDG